MLTRTNYQEWAMLMQVNFEAAGWWYAVEPEVGEEVNYRHDRLALAAILRSVPPEMLSSLRERRNSAAEAWMAIKRIRVGVTRVREANAQQLRREFNALVWKEAETAEDFANRITGLAADLRLLGDNLPDVDVVRKMLQLVPEHLAQVAISIETQLDVNLMSVEEVTGRLRAVEQRHKAAPVTDSQGRLLLCEEEWRAKLNLRDSDGKSSSSGSSGAGGKKRGGRAAVVGATRQKPPLHRRATVRGRPPAVTSASAAANTATGPRIAVASPRPRPTSRRRRRRTSLPC